jgi:hypothetical protein
VSDFFESARDLEDPDLDFSPIAADDVSLVEVCAAETSLGSTLMGTAGDSGASLMRRLGARDGVPSLKNPASSAKLGEPELSDSIRRCDDRLRVEDCLGVLSAVTSRSGAIKSVSLARRLDSRESECAFLFLEAAKAVDFSNGSWDFVA